MSAVPNVVLSSAMASLNVNPEVIGKNTDNYFIPCFMPVSIAIFSDRVGTETMSRSLKA